MPVVHDACFAAMLYYQPRHRFFDLLISSTFTSPVSLFRLFHTSFLIILIAAFHIHFLLRLQSLSMSISSPIDCSFVPISAPVTDVLLSNGASFRGVNMQVGTPPQTMSFLPAMYVCFSCAAHTALSDIIADRLIIHGFIPETLHVTMTRV